MVMTLMSISQSLYDFSQQDFYHRHPSHTYIYVTHLIFCGRIFKHTILKVQYNKRRNTKTKEHTKLWELSDNSMSFTPFLPKPSPHTIHRIYFQKCTSLLRKELVTKQYSSSKSVTHLTGPQ